MRECDRDWNDCYGKVDEYGFCLTCGGSVRENVEFPNTITAIAVGPGFVNLHLRCGRVMREALEAIDSGNSDMARLILKDFLSEEKT